MKRFLILLVCVFGLQTLVKADNEKLIQISQLPATAKIILPDVPWLWPRWTTIISIKAMM